MSLSVWFSFCITCILLIVPPGPTTTYLVTSSMIYGRRVAIEIILGNLIGGLLALFCSLLGISVLFKTFPPLFDFLRLLGIIYLIFLGLRSFQSWKKAEQSEEFIPLRQGQAFRRSVSLICLNPRNLIFFTTFFPQFIQANFNLFYQMLILATTYLLIGLINDISYSFCAVHLSQFLGKTANKWIARLGGGAMIASAIIILVQF